VTDAGVVVARAVSKRFGAVQALHDVDLVLGAGRVHALVGENGAGKSTLAKVLAGLVRPDAGELMVDGAARHIADRREALRLGIGFVPQSLSLIGELTLVENCLLDSDRRRVNRGAARRSLQDAADQAGIGVPLDVPTGQLGLGLRQLGEVLVALAAGARVLLLDEPTASLGPAEIGGLFEHVRQLAAGGTGVLLITHRVDEVRLVADEVTVLSHGCRVHHGPITAVDDHELAVLMVGELQPAPPPLPRSRTGVRLSVRGLSVPARRGPAIDNIDLEVSGGDIVAVAGVAGSGQRTLAEAVAGLAAPSAGSVTIDGADVTARPARAARLGLAYIPEERSDALLATLNVGDNAALFHLRDPSFRRAGMRVRRRVREFAIALCQRYDVRPPRPELLAAGLSGGNQQKLLVGRELERQPAVVVAHGPTQGLDLRAGAAIRAELVAAATAGAAVLVVSADLDEVLALADRIVVMVGGRIVDDFPAADASTQRLGRAMAGLATAAAVPPPND
jgi:general nucleoside transport system ATP-binding protein